MNRLANLIARLDDPRVVLRQLRILVIVSICALPFAFKIGADYILDRERSGWCQEDAAKMVVAFHIRHQRFPSGWNEAVLFYPQREYGGSLTPDETRKRVIIDFDHPPAAPGEASPLDHKSRPINYITLRNGRRDWWQGGEPNTMVLQYLRGDDLYWVDAAKEQIGR